MHDFRLVRRPLGALLLGASALVHAGEAAEPVPQVVVAASRVSQLGVADSANAGVVTQQQLAARSVYRPGELLEATPGLIVSQHSGEGKANQFYLRGFNLDHGTDLRTTVDGMLVNQRSHAHGQGWTDLNFLIPELANRLEYRKGPYYADEGDFAAAGALAVRYADTLPEGLASVGLGQNGYRRALLADSPNVGNGKLLYALESFHNDGPFTRGDDFNKLNGVLRYSQGDAAKGVNVTAMAYRAAWRASDQIPRRAVDDGRLGRFDTVDASDGGVARRYSLSGGWHAASEAGVTRVNASVVANRLELYSNFTYFLDDPVNGDQFSQPDRRVTSAVNAEHRWGSHRVGFQFQNDNIHNGLYDTVARRRRATTREDHIVETSAAVFYDNSTRWTPMFRSVAGVRVDHYRFDVDSILPENSGRASASRASPTLSLIFGPWSKTELYLNAGTGFHSNDARGTTIRTDPKSGEASERVTPLVKAKGVEVGVRTEALAGLQSSLSVYQLDVDSELVFVGDAGTTEAGRPSRRSGFEFSNYYKPNAYMSVDADVAFARARFRNADAAGRRIPGAVEGVASLALALDNLGPWFGALQLRYFGPRPLIEDNGVRSRSTTTLNGRIGYKLGKRLKLELEGFNLANRRSSAIDYFYESRLQGEDEAVEDIHFHPTESRSFRLTLSSAF
ncbi:TonB-dependent receptor [Massilia aquatica]|uniref:TonB-dependent receptor plug domain-containing protein n=1 Tax=Massilia aquatica TaxID=2609000 RepID=A0ABX0MJ88_9BURK|nr:TonB-dependent receptor [Massilia aquatica]NHZ44475.1 TonB-dependent receptor plug domain-containing protein [Massilia aquatica]